MSERRTLARKFEVAAQPRENNEAKLTSVQSRNAVQMLIRSTLEYLVNQKNFHCSADDADEGCAHSRTLVSSAGNINIRTKVTNVLFTAIWPSSVAEMSMSIVET